MRNQLRNSRRKRWPLRIGLFLVYVLVQYVTSENVTEEAVSYPDTTEQEVNSTVESTSELPMIAEETNIEPPKAEKPSKSEEKPSRGKSGKVQGQSQEEIRGKDAGLHSLKNVPRTTTVPTTTTMKYERATWRPRRENCSPPAIEQFPRPLMGPNARKHGGLIIHILVAVYTFLGLAIVCDDYFVSSLDRICEELRLSPDVAGATFMAAGSSAPELATVVIGVFFAKDDIGVSGVIGSAVFNIMFVISICGLCTTTASKLNWWPLCRDCFFYAVSILVMLGTIYNESISWTESLFMLIMYGVYCVALSFNARLERWAKSYDIPFLPKDDEPAEESALVSYKSLQEDRLSYTGPSSPVTDQFDKMQEGEIGGTAGAAGPPGGPETNEPPTRKQPEYYKAKEPDPNEVSPLERPTDGSQWSLFTWGLVYPIHFLCRATMPDCRQEKFRNWYPFTFCVSMVWISFYSYIMVWMITIIGSTLGIPDTVMGLTFVAAGVSVPDALSSLAVIKEGLGDMAVSNAVGSNVFDILVCLGLPWFIQTAMIQPGSHVNVTSRGLTYSTLSLLSTVVFLVLATHLNGWKLDRRYGVVLMLWYLVFIVFASLYELNVFGEMNPPVCKSAF
ncbi:probable sodium/potassium/calcium exchanger CG1090 isoform X2 [Osmia bicornis bicornis]|nr:probable sodium/potassium/calcium exchanger CG1090 isoform X2 [Osmia bicornis bicornis]XP_046142763.1 probable sodium/potassium/calcium exchanger CG1090 isoform X2 [Osmia bicornis bicornis]XP_046142764.1 probable sodium/potassium/calcium exchanger CG1090 isoform X2 [Osmia bicornis bicornis]XP_046142765.1 probable sodium/potassium/calcium exchanger CG1090 isoform X2 [Osmia bicornis bicornis]